MSWPPHLNPLVPPTCSTQDEPAFCGLASLAMVLNALAIDPRRTWKGAWRWFHEQVGLAAWEQRQDGRAGYRGGSMSAPATCLWTLLDSFPPLEGGTLHSFQGRRPWRP